MGEVYRAHDSKLGRDVAVKVLPANFVNDPERLARFQREARMLAALNHANIATIHGLEQSGGVTCLVMVLVSGQTLAERVKAGPLGIEEALKVGVQIAEALEAAHEKSIIHRDLKPANVKVTPEGKVKVLDFGLAKAFAGDAANDDPSNPPTLSAAATMQGVILGTAAYMSPEQARGKACDKRTDIWAFGCVLYELLTGKQAFQGESTTEILAAVLKEEPDWKTLPASTPTKIQDLLRRCLQKEMNKRARDAGDVRIEIEEALAAPAKAEPAAAVKGIRALGRRWLIISVGALLLVGVIASLATWNLKPSPSQQPVTRTVITLPPGQQLVSTVALSPDGNHLAYVALQGGGSQQLYVRAMNSLEAKPIPGTEGAIEPFFSPEGQWVAFFADQRLKKVSVGGGAVLTLCDVSIGTGGSWGSQGTIIFGNGAGGPLQQVSDVGGTPQRLTHLDKGEISYRWPDLLPSGKAVLFAAGTIGTDWTNPQVAVQSIETGERRDLIQGGTYPRYALSGHLIYVQGGNLMAMPFDPQRLAVTGTAVPVVEGPLRSTTNGDAQYSISATGSLVYVRGGQAAQLRLVWVNRKGAEQLLSAAAHAYVNPRISPNGRLVSVDIREQGRQVWLYDLSRETLTRLTFEGSSNSTPVWTPDGKRIAFQSNKEGSTINLFWLLADGSGGLERLATSEYLQAPNSWSQDGQLLAFTELSPTTGWDIWVLRLGDRKAQPFLRTPFTEGAPRFSPDGRWLAYVSNESGRYEIYIQPYPGPGGKRLISTDGGTEPMWNHNGRELFYRSGDKMMSVEIATQPSFAASKPRMLFEGPYVPTAATIPNYDVSPDGQRFLMLKPIEQATQINVVLNWFEELKRRVPAGTK
jgi:serine/threonine-protein kinase